MGFVFKKMGSGSIGYVLIKFIPGQNHINTQKLMVRRNVKVEYFQLNKLREALELIEGEPSGIIDI